MDVHGLLAWRGTAEGVSKVDDEYDEDYGDGWNPEIDSWPPCGMCGGDGELDAYELDPLYYAPGDTTVCPQCGGHGEEPRG